MSKTIEEIRAIVATDQGYDSWEDFLEWEDADDVAYHLAIEYSNQQTQELQDHNANLANNLLEMSNSLVGLIKENNNLKDLSNTITGLQLQEQNAELVEMLSLVCMDLEERGRAYGDAYTMSKELLTKHNHLKSNTNG